MGRERQSRLWSSPREPRTWPSVGQALDGAPGASQSPEQAQCSVPGVAGPGPRGTPRDRCAPVSTPMLLLWLERSTVATWEAGIGGHGARGAGELGPTSVPSGEPKIAPKFIRRDRAGVLPGRSSLPTSLRAPTVGGGGSWGALPAAPHRRAAKRAPTGKRDQHKGTTAGVSAGRRHPLVYASSSCRGSEMA